MDIKITADSTCDLPQHLVEAYDIHLIPLYVVLGEQSYADRLEINPAQLFAYMKDDKHTCHTSAGMFTEYRQAFQDNQHFEAIIHISLSSVISCSHENAVMAAAKFNNVYVVDSANLCGGSGLIVERAAQLAALGLSAEEIVARLQKMKAKIDSSFIVNNLEYLKRGGRCSSLSEISANLLQIKPVIEVTEGQMQVGKKYRGSFVKCVIKYLAKRLSDRQDIADEVIYLATADCEQEVVAEARNMIKQMGYFKRIVELEAGCVISCHCGPGALGIFFERK